MRYQSFREILDKKPLRIAIIGLSGVGKTTTSELLRRSGWFRFSVDYRIGTHHLADEITNLFAKYDRDSSFMQDVLAHKAADPITLKPHIDFNKHNLYAISAYLGMMGDPIKGGLPEAEFRKRLSAHRAAEIATMLEGAIDDETRNVVMDVSGSLCEIVDIDDDDDLVLANLKDNYLVVYISSDSSHDKILAQRQKKDPKPLFYRSEFLDKHLPDLLNDMKVDSVEKVDPVEVGNWLFPKLIAERRIRYRKIADKIGYTISMDDVYRLKSEDDFLKLIAKTIDQKHR